MLATLGALTEALAAPVGADSVPGEVLASVLDAAALSTGAAWVAEPGGRLGLAAQLGFGPEAAEVETLFGHPELLDRVVQTGTPLALTPAAVPDPAAEAVRTRAGVRSALLLPLAARNEPLGLLLIASRARDLSDPEWLAFAQVLGAQVSPAIVLARSVGRLAASEGSPSPRAPRRAPLTGVRPLLSSIPGEARATDGRRRPP